MAPVISAVQTTPDIPAQTVVVVIGAGIVGLSAALTLAERGIPVVVLDKGRVAAEQSSRNLGWVRKTSRALADVPLALAADRLWAEMPARTGEDGGYRQAGIMFVARSETQMALYEKWLASVAHLDLGSRLLSPGEIACDQVLLAGGLGTRRFLGNMGIAFPALPLICSVLRSAPMEGPTDIAVGAPDFSFRKRHDGGFTITQRGRLDAPLTPDHLRIGLRYLPQLRAQRGALKIGLGRAFLRDLATARHWHPDSVSPFEQERITDPRPNRDLNAEALRNLRAAWPVFEKLQIVQSWAGTIDVTPDSDPVISGVAQVPGLTIASGFSGHGFGTGPAAGHLAADLVSAHTPIVDPAPYRFGRFSGAAS